MLPPDDYVNGKSKKEYITDKSKSKKYRKRKNHKTYKKNEQLRQVKILYLNQSPYCIYCGIPLTYDTATLDHIIPKSRRGTDQLANLVLCCNQCNEEKGCLSLQNFITSRNNNLDNPN
jgi:5-methylcytosine-specific restriction endonuclease McrA